MSTSSKGNRKLSFRLGSKGAEGNQVGSKLTVLQEILLKTICVQLYAVNYTYEKYSTQ